MSTSNSFVSRKIPPSIFDVAKMTYLLDHDNQEFRNRFREFIKDPIFIPRYDISLRFERFDYLDNSINSALENWLWSDLNVFAKKN
jgi:hypothetical protein